MNRIFKTLLNRLAPITIRVYWMGEVTIHKSWTREDALTWMSCYPRDAFIFVRNRAGCVAIREAHYA